MRKQLRRKVLLESLKRPMRVATPAYISVRSETKPDGVDHPTEVGLPWPAMACQDRIGPMLVMCLKVDAGKLPPYTAYGPGRAKSVCQGCISRELGF